MEIKVKLPKPNNTHGHAAIMQFLRQLELTVHHAQKAAADMTLTDDSYITYRFPKIDLYDRQQDEDGYVKVHVDEEGEQMQEIEIEIAE